MILWIFFAVFVILLIVSISGDLFLTWSFATMIFYLLFFIAGYYYVKISYENREKELDELMQKKLKFDWCWNKVNQLLRRMPGGQGIQWTQGVGKRSSLKFYHDGVQNKPFRSMIAHLENSQQLVMIILDVEGEDIVEFIANPSPDILMNPWLNFKPFMRGQSNGNRSPFGGRGYSPYSRYSRYSGSYRGRSSGYGGYGGGGNYDDGGSYGNATEVDMGAVANKNNQKLKPDANTIDNALNKLTGRR